jgi:hypothetical protein
MSLVAVAAVEAQLTKMGVAEEAEGVAEGVVAAMAQLDPKILAAKRVQVILAGSWPMASMRARQLHARAHTALN